MLMNILYYGMDNTPNADGLSFGLINVTLQQVSVGIITNLIVFPPSFLLVQLFKRTKQRHTRLSKIKSLLNKHNPIENKEKEEEEEYSEVNNKVKEKTKLELKFPWWFKFVLYAVSFIIASVCLFFIVIKGIVFGNDKSTKWITSVVVSILSSILVTQPLQVLKSKTLNLFDIEFV